MNKTIHSQILILYLALLLTLVNLAVYLPVKDFKFVDYDDYLYVVQNSNIREISNQSVLWAFTTQYAANWHPVTWLSHMADYRFFGLSPGGHHLENLLIHSFNTLVLLLLMLRLTGKLWHSLAIALLFAVHPLHVESVAWVSERKDLLCAFFGFLSIYTFSVYVENKKISVYLVSLLIFAVSLMAKPMLVTLPFILLLLDYRQFRHSGGDRCRVSCLRKPAGVLALLVEKIPFFALSLFSSVITFIAQKNGGAVSTLELVPLANRLTNALDAYAVYIYRTLLPLNLSLFYPYQSHLPGLRLFTVLISLLAITVLLFRLSGKEPWLFVGWLWFLGTLVPVIGLVQVGGQSMADRYMYVPIVGLLIVFVYGTAAILEYAKRTALYGILLLLFVALFSGLLSWRQAGYWKDSASLFSRAVRVNPENYMAHTRLGVALSSAGRVSEALSHYIEAVRIKPGYVTSYYDMAVDLDKSGRAAEAKRALETAIRISPSFFTAIMKLGDIYAREGRFKEAARQYLKASRLKPESPRIYNTLGILYAKAGWMKKASETLTRGVSIFPDQAELRNNLGLAYYRMGEYANATGELEAAIRLETNYPEAHNNLGLALVRTGSIKVALMHFREALRLKPGYSAAVKNIKKAEQLERRLR